MGRGGGSDAVQLMPSTGPEDGPDIEASAFHAVPSQAGSAQHMDSDMIFDAAEAVVVDRAGREATVTAGRGAAVMGAVQGLLGGEGLALNSVAGGCGDASTAQESEKSMERLAGCGQTAGECSEVARYAQVCEKGRGRLD